MTRFHASRIVSLAVLGVSDGLVTGGSTGSMLGRASGCTRVYGLWVAGLPNWRWRRRTA